MSQSQARDIPDEVPPKQVYLPGKLRMRFYEPLVLLVAATQACLHDLAPRVPDPAPDRWSQTQEQLFHDFMNKLAQICDTRSKGPTVTAVVALSLPDRVQYRFASNQRSEGELEQMKAYVTDILHTLRDWTEEESLLVKAKLLQKVVLFTRPRLEGYIRAVAKYSIECLGAAGIDLKVTQKLEELYQISSRADDPGLTENAFFQDCASLMESIRKLSKSSTYRTFRNKANSTQIGQTNPWAELRHASGRLLSYLEGVQTLVEAREQPQWAQLFHDFEVVCIASSQPDTNPIVDRRKRVTAAEILIRMTPPQDEPRLALFQAGAKELQRFDLDGNIRRQNESKFFQPFVHAEILVYDSLRDQHDLRYFHGYNYIGTSKPPCRLCDYYFQSVSRMSGDRVQVRQSHGNLYLNWRVPDIYEHQIGAMQRQEKILNDMNLCVRQDTYRTLQDKIGMRKSHDSNTSRTYERRPFSVECSSVAEDDIDEVSSMMGGARL